MDTDTPTGQTVALVVDVPELQAASTATLLRSAYALTHRMDACGPGSVEQVRRRRLREQRNLIDAELLVRCGPGPRITGGH